jgi:hypothetical protein
MLAVATQDVASPPPPSPWRVGLALRTGLVAGAAPDATVAGALAATARKGALWGELGVRGRLPNRESGTQGLTVWGGSGSLLLCAGRRAGFLEGRACSGMEAGVLRATAYGYDVSHPQLGRITNVLGRLGVAVGLGGRWALTADGDLGLNLVRNRFTARLADGGDAVLWQPPRTATGVDIGLEMRLR